MTVGTSQPQEPVLSKTNRLRHIGWQLNIVEGLCSRGPSAHGGCGESERAHGAPRGLRPSRRGPARFGPRRHCTAAYPVSGPLFIVGAGPGLGKALATRFAEGGWDLGLIARRQPVVDDCLADLRGHDIRLQGTVADVTDAPALDQAFDVLADAIGAPTVMIYNASLYQPEPALELSPDDLNRSFAIHVLGAFNAAKSAVRLMRPAGHGILTFTINCLAVRPGRVIMRKTSGYTLDRLAQERIEVLSLDFEAVCRGGGGIHCSTAPLVRDPV